MTKTTAGRGCWGYTAAIPGPRKPTCELEPVMPSGRSHYTQIYPSPGDQELRVWRSLGMGTCSGSLPLQDREWRDEATRESWVEGLEEGDGVVRT